MNYFNWINRDYIIMAELDSIYLNSVVAIGIDTSKPPNFCEWVGTGFLISEYVKDDNGKVVIGDDGLAHFNAFLVTNRHVLEENKVKDMGFIIVRFRTKKDGQTIEYKLPIVDRKTSPPQLWVSHPDDNIDIAAIGLVPNQLKEDGRQFEDFPHISDGIDNKGLMTIEQMNEKKVAEGDPIYIPGYPLGLVDSNWTDATVLYGYIAQIRGALARQSPSFVIDASLVPGNSGSPVIREHYFGPMMGFKDSKYERLREQNGKLIVRGSIIGIVSTDIFYNIIQGQRKANWNTRLVRVFPSDYILKTIEKCNERGANTFVPMERRQ